MITHLPRYTAIKYHKITAFNCDKIKYEKFVCDDPRFTPVQLQVTWLGYGGLFGGLSEPANHSALATTSRVDASLF